MPEVVDDSPNPGLGSPAPILHDNVTYQTPLAQRSRAKCEITDSTQTDSPLKLSTQDLDSARLEYLSISPRNHESRGHEEITILEENDGRTSRMDKSRRGTVGNTDIRSTSPPNSVKAFADARRRERELSCSDPSTNKAISDSRRLDEFDVNRAVSRALSRDSRRSHRSRRSKRYVTEKEDEEDGATRSDESSGLAKEDVCFPLNPEGNKDSLQIDFGILENFIADAECREKTPTVPQNQPRIFDDLRQDQSDNQVHFTQSGDFLDIPPPSSIGLSRKSSVNVSLKNSAGEQERHFENRFEFFSSLGESTIHASEFGDLVLPGDDFRTLFTLSKEDDLGGVWWLNMNNPNNLEIRTICTAFSVHPLTMEDIVTQEAHEKIELFPSYYFACFRSFHVEKVDGGQQYVPFNIYVIVFREGTLSFSFYPNPHATHVRKRITMLKDYVALSSDWICYALIDNIVDSFAPIISKIESETDDIEDEVFIARNDDMHTFLRKIGMVRKNVMGLMKLLGGKADVLRGFTKRCNADYKVTPRMDIGLYLGDIQDHVVTMMASLAHFEKMLSRSHSNYLAQLSIDNITQGNHANKVLSKITLLASILVPLNLVCGMFGMNVKVPWRDADSLGPFFGILGLLSILTIISLYAARRLRFI